MDAIDVYWALWALVAFCVVMLGIGTLLRWIAMLGVALLLLTGQASAQTPTPLVGCCNCGPSANCETPLPDWSCGNPVCTPCYDCVCMTAPTLTPTPLFNGTPPPDHSSENIALYYEEGGTLGVNNAGATSCGGTGANCNLTNVSDATADTTNFRQGIQSVAMTRAGGGRQYCLNATCTALTRSSSTTWATWARATTDITDYPLFGKGYFDAGSRYPDQYFTIREASNDRPLCYVGDGASPVADGTMGGSSWTAGTAWHHITCIWDQTHKCNGSTTPPTGCLKTCFDGANCTAGTDVTAMADNQHFNFVLGGGSTAGGGLDGNLDETLVYNGMWSQAADCFVNKCGVDSKLCMCNGTAYLSCAVDADCNTGGVGPALCGTDNKCSGRANACSLPTTCSQSTLAGM